MDIIQYVGQKVRILTVDDNVFYGKVIDYIDAEDNEPEGESIVLRSPEHVGVLFEFRPEEIKEITIIQIVQYDRVLLNDGTQASIVEIFDNGKAYLADIDKPDGTVTDWLKPEDILKVLRFVNVDDKKE